MTQQILVGFIVALAVLFAAWRLPGRATRLRYVGWIRRLSGGHGPLARLAWRLEARLRREDSACSGCSASADHVPPPGGRTPGGTRRP